MAFTKHETETLQKGLYLEQRKGAKHYKVRALLDGIYYFKNTETTDYLRAKRFALSWVRSLRRAKEGNPANASVWGVAKGYLESLPPDAAWKRATHKTKWNTIQRFFMEMDIADVDAKVLNDFVKWRSGQTTRYGTIVKKITVQKNLTVLRQILKWANREGLIDRVPLFPPLGRIESNPRPWLNPAEWQKLQTVAKKRIEEEGLDLRTKQRREELYDFALMMVHSCARVDEVRRLRVRDCVVRTKTVEDYAKKDKKGGTRYLEMRVRGKTGPRDAIGWSGAVTAYQRCVERRAIQLGRPVESDTLLFSEHHRDAFRELLIAADVRTDDEGRTRNLKSLRPTGLMMRILADPKINLKYLAMSAGTSMQMLDTFYLKRLSLKNPVALSELV